ncbi:MAG: hypothetical protein V4671_06040 [Armatimonadota bacterium]
MTRSIRAITLLAVWLTVLFAGPVLPAFASSCALPVAIQPVSSPSECPMGHGAAMPDAGDGPQACCCCSPGNASAHTPLSTSFASDTLTEQVPCECSVQPGVPVVPSDTLQAPIPSFAIALAEVPVVAAIPPMAHLTADSPLPPFAARLRLPHHAHNAGRAPPVA